MVAALQTPASRPQKVLGLLPTGNLQETPEPHWKKTNVLIVKKRDTGKMNALREKGGTKRSSNWSDEAATAPPNIAHGYPSTGGKAVKFLCDTDVAYSVIKKPRVPYLKKNCLFKGPQELNKTTTGQKAELLT
jgi:hypothetical protein